MGPGASCLGRGEQHPPWCVTRTSVARQREDVGGNQQRRNEEEKTTPVDSGRPTDWGKDRGPATTMASDSSERSGDMAWSDGAAGLSGL
ncbi:hypothetical protein E2562_031967 [Oryza meyeriana var. granulata]|uniref:Uncharacterized protein n=1 Tax=Oryza meyeriana var. granulata TaxID=110450 RepID=A0A6G1ERU9_9ORYZ|nr:hypothetical protein E2562_031967 [Oryza meyeriana var. granulata]